jgi:NAD(P)-dependent dehydrogenase (short-subunit alcohol dehydrogenase family)
MNKQVLVTGANKGIGYEIARHLGKSGWQVIVGARNEERAENAVKKLREDGAEILGWQYVNLSDNTEIEKSAKEITERFPDLSLLVNNAGIPGDMAVKSYEQTLQDVIDTVQVNYIGTFYLTKQLLALLEKNHGRICNITVPSVFSPYWHPMAYVASKAGQNTMTSTMAWEFDHFKVPVEIFDIHPGATSTDLNNHYSGPGSHQPNVIGEKVAGILNDGKRHNGEFIELHPIVDEGNY